MWCSAFGHAQKWLILLLIVLNGCSTPKLTISLNGHTNNTNTIVSQDYKPNSYLLDKYAANPAPLIFGTIPSTSSIIQTTTPSLYVPPVTSTPSTSVYNPYGPLLSLIHTAPGGTIVNIGHLQQLSTQLIAIYQALPPNMTLQQFIQSQYATAAMSASLRNTSSEPFL